MSHTPHPDDDGCDLGTGMFRGEVVEVGDPLAIARAVARQVAVIAPPEPTPLSYAVCVDGAPVEDYRTGAAALARAEEIRRDGYLDPDDEAGGYKPDVVTVLVWVEEEA